MTIQANQGLGVSVFGATSAGGGGGGTPGGSSGQVQYNNGGSFGGMSGTSWDNTNVSLTITGATLTGATSYPVLNLSQTWNNGTTTFTGLKFNATDTASASGSLLLDLQTGAASVFNVTKTGGFTFTDTSTTTGSTSWNFYASNLTAPGSATLTIGKNTNARTNVIWDSLATTATVSAYNSGTTAHVTLLAGGTSGNLYLRPGSSGATQLGAADAAAPVAQTLQVQSVVGSTPGATDVAGANWTIKGSAGRGSGAGGSIIFQVAPAGSAGTGAQNAYATALTLNSSQQAVFADGSATVPPIRGADADTGIFFSGNNIRFTSDGENRFSLDSLCNLNISSLSAVRWTNGSNPNTGHDVILLRDAANTLALRNSTNAQRFNVYNTYTSSTNYETFKIDWITTANTCLIGTEKGSGGGTARGLAIQTDGTTRMSFAADNSLATISSTNLITGTQIRINSATRLTNSSDGVLQLSDSSQNDFNRLQFGGTTSSYPALKRISSGNCLQVIAADNTASAGFIVGNQALATTATDGFLYVPTCAGLPTGTPTTQTGTAPIVVDTTNNKLYFYSGGAWRDAGP